MENFKKTHVPRKYCSACRKIIVKSATFCHYCGTDLIKYRKGTVKRCSYCNCAILSEMQYCDRCGTKNIKIKEKERIENDEEPFFDLKNRTNCEGSSLFKPKTALNFFLKNGKIKISTMGFGSIMFNIKEDFCCCEKLGLNEKKVLKLNITDNYLKLVFNDDYFIIKDNADANDIATYIYENIATQVYETENVFYNTEHKQFDLF